MACDVQVVSLVDHQTMHHLDCAFELIAIADKIHCFHFSSTIVFFYV